MDAQKEARLSLLSIYFTFFIDNLCWSIVFPIFAPYFLDPGNRLFSADFSEGSRTMVLGFFLMAFSFGQFLGAPLIGEYGDRNGRRKALILGVFFTLAGLAMSAWSMAAGNLYLLFAGRLITGIFSSNMSVCLACVSDLSTGESKAKNYGTLSVIAGLSFVLGAFLGGKLSDPSIHPSFSFNFPLWIATGMSALNLIFLYFGFRETFQVRPDVKYRFFESFENLKIALKTERIKRVYSVYFLFLFAWTMLFQFTPVIAVDSYSFTSSNIGDLALFMGICWAIGSYLNQMLLYYFPSVKILEACLVAFTIFCALIIFPKNLYGVLTILGLCVVIGGIAWPLCTALISDLSPKEMQGKILGMSQSVQSFAMAAAPLIGGIAYVSASSLPFWIGSGASLIAVSIYFTLKDR